MRDDRTPDRHGRFGVVVAVALVALMVIAIGGAIASNRMAARTRRAVLLDTAYKRAATGVAAEESLERKYRLEPGPVPLGAHRAAQTEVRRALGQIHSLGNASDRRLADLVAHQHESYVHAATIMFAAVDHHEPPSVVNAIDGKTVDPVFGAMQTETYAAASAHERSALRTIDDMATTNHFVLGIDLASLIAGITLVIVAGIMLTRSRRRLTEQSRVNLHQALHDSLTGLPNRTLFQDRTTQALLAAERSGTQVAVMLVDIDRFKDVNDTLGHHYGDLLLRQIADRFKSTLRAGDSVARLGGDEFAVLLCGTTAADSQVAATRLTEVLETAFLVKDISLDVEASIGIALAGPEADVDSALRHADVAMYEAKSHHLAHATYELNRDDNTVARLALLGDLRRAIGAGELQMEYQPKVSTVTGELHSVEALVRWNNPQRGLLMPDDFIPIAEGTAVIHPLTREILRQVLVQTRRWLDQGQSIPVAVNISSRSLNDLGFPAEVAKQLLTAGVGASHLSLEITESAIMVDPVRALTVLQELDAMGVELSIDDFGTGYSSMAYLKNLPVRELKIDRSFVMGMSTNAGDEVLVQSAVDLGHNLGLHVVAEGVEDAATQAALIAMGCDLLQGFHIRRPTSASELDAWLIDHPSRLRSTEAAHAASID
jgi:diguanylate cyclase (GGDEF)-like protein